MDLLAYYMLYRYIIAELKELIEDFPAIAIIGPRQVGKTTLVKELTGHLNRDMIYIDLENPRDEAKLNDPVLFFETHLNKCIVIDEIQRNKKLFPILRSMIDLDRRPGRFLLLGSASPELIRDSSESLAGRIMYKELSPINVLELDTNLDTKQLLFRGGFPNSLLARSDKSGTRWLESFIQTYIEKDLPLLGMPMQPSETRKMLKMLAHLQGQLLNHATLAKSLGITSPTVKKYIYFLEHAFILRSLEPYTINVGKRVSKSPKLYIRDSGIVNYLLGINSYDDLVSHPDAGNIWEGFVIEQICSLLPYDVDKSFYRTQHGAEIDLILSYSNGHKIGIEIKFSSSPSLSKGNYEAMKDLQLDKLYVITPTDDCYPMKEKVEVIGLRDMLNLLLSKHFE